MDMSTLEQARFVSLTAENIRDIEQTNVEFDPGVTLEVGD